MKNNGIILQQATGNHCALLSLSHTQHARYAATHAFDLWPIYGEVKGCEGRHPFWAKVALIKQAIRAGYRFIVWLDADTLIVTEEDLRSACPDGGIGMTYHSMDWGEGTLAYDHHNAGALYMEVTPETEAFVRCWWETPDGGHPWGDQHAMMQTALLWPQIGEKKPAPVVTIDHRWNSTEHFPGDNPAVLAWHGYGGVQDRLRAMQQALLSNRRFDLSAQTAGEAFLKAENYAQSKQYEPAVALYQVFLSALAQSPPTAEEVAEDPTPYEGIALKHLAHCLVSLNRWADAEPVLRILVEQEPRNGEAWRMLGGVLCYLGEHEESVAVLLKAEECSPHAPAVQLNLALWNLMEGNWIKGFDLLRWDFLQGGRKLRHVTPEWRGGRTGTLFIWAEQGLGDTLMLFRFLPALIRSGFAERIMLEVTEPLVELLRGQYEGIEVLPRPLDGSIFADFDDHCGTFSLPAILKVTPELLPSFWSGPYINVQPAAIADGDPDFRLLTGAVETLKPFRVGFSWAGSRGHAADANRSTDPAMWDVLVNTPGCEFVSLQHGEPIPQSVIDSTPEVRFVGQTLTDLRQVAEEIAQCDLIITVDSAIAHLAGAMGVPVYLLLSYSHDWRWLRWREDSVWYPRHRIFKQESLGDWAGVFARVEEALKIVAEHRCYPECFNMKWELKHSSIPAEINQ